MLWNRPYHLCTDSPHRFFLWIGGNDSNWFDASNWSTGQIPSATDNVILKNDAKVVIAPLISPVSVVVNNMTIRDNAVLTTLANTILTYNQLIIKDAGLLDAKSSEIHGDELLLAINDGKIGSGGMYFNPTTNDTRLIKITANTAGIYSVGFSLGGHIAASPGNVGQGFYANITADEVELDGGLKVNTLYGYLPSVGERLRIISARKSLIGTFSNFAEGDIVQRYKDVHLIITYVGGDGNDVELIARPNPSTRQSK